MMLFQQFFVGCFAAAGWRKKRMGGQLLTFRIAGRNKRIKKTKKISRGGDDDTVSSSL